MNQQNYLWKKASDNKKSTFCFNENYFSWSTLYVPERIFPPENVVTFVHSKADKKTESKSWW